MIIKKNATTALLGGAALSLALATGPLQAAGTADDVQADPTVVKADGTAMTAEELEMAAEKAGEKVEEGATAMKEGAEEMANEAEEEAEGVMATVADALDDDETAAMLQQEMGLHPELGAYGLDVTEIDGRYSVNGRIDKSEDFATLEQMLADVESVDPALIDNDVVLD